MKCNTNIIGRIKLNKEINYNDNVLERKKKNERNMANELNFQEAILQQMQQQQQNQQMLAELMNRVDRPQRPVTEVTPPIFSGKEKECVIDWLSKFNRISAHNGWDDEKELNALPIYLSNGALVYYNSLDDHIKENAVLIKQALRDYYDNQNRRWQKRTELFGLKQNGKNLDDYIDKINKLSQQLNVAAEVKTDIFISGLDDKLKNALKLRQPQNFEDAITFARLKDNTKTNNEVLMEQILETLKTNNTNLKTLEESASAKLNNEIKAMQKDNVAAAHTNPTGNLREIARLKEEVRQLKRSKMWITEEISNQLEKTSERNLGRSYACAATKWDTIKDLVQRCIIMEQHKGIHQQMETTDPTDIGRDLQMMEEYTIMEQDTAMDHIKTISMEITTGIDNQINIKTAMEGISEIIPMIKIKMVIG